MVEMTSSLGWFCRVCFNSQRVGPDVLSHLVFKMPQEGVISANKDEFL